MSPLSPEHVPVRKYGMQFSGGKDSLAALYLSKRLWPEMIVFYADTGGFYPHMVRFVHETCQQLGLPLLVVRPDESLEQYHARTGLPSDIIPVEQSLEMQPYNRNIIGLQSPIRCCAMMQWRWLAKAILQSGVKNVIRGSKKVDQHVGVGDGYVDSNGITYHCPLWTWTDDMVFDYLESIGAKLADHYKEVNNSFDCIICTAFLRSDGAKKRLEYTRKHYPQYMPELSKRVNFVRDIIESEHKAVMDVMSVVTHEKENADG